MLQDSYFTAVDLAEIGQRLNDQENEMLTHQGITQQQQASNFDDSGYFSVQVIFFFFVVFIYYNICQIIKS